MTAFWAGRRVLVTGHTGFKGAWLSCWLERLGAVVSAFALPEATTPSLSALLPPGPCTRRATVDLRDAPGVARLLGEAQPEIVIHMAAQSLVRPSYDDPAATYLTNVVGTANLLAAVREVAAVRAVVVVTTDKVYRNDDGGRPFVESDPLGGKDPYSASKACVELLSHSFRESFFKDGPALATARAGNVVGGGDWACDRLVPDIVRALAADRPVQLRYPDAVRPWQHVLEPLAGYLALAQALVERPRRAPTAVNLGPAPLSFAPVRRVAQALCGRFGVDTTWQDQAGDHPPEAHCLTLRSDLAKTALGWQSRLSLAETLAWTADWYLAHRDGADMHDYTLDQIARYEQLLA